MLVRGPSRVTRWRPLALLPPALWVGLTAAGSFWAPQHRPRGLSEPRAAVSEPARAMFSTGNSASTCRTWAGIMGRDQWGAGQHQATRSVTGSVRTLSGDGAPETPTTENFGVRGWETPPHWFPQNWPCPSHSCLGLTHNPSPTQPGTKQRTGSDWTDTPVARGASPPGGLSDTVHPVGLFSPPQAPRAGFP